MELELPCHVINKRPNANGYIGVVVGGPGRGKRGAPKARRTTAHRSAWEVARGPIPEGLFVLHHCDNPPCDELTHLYLGTHDDNMRDVSSRGRAFRTGVRKTHCRNGHPFDVSNTYINPKNGAQMCKECRRAANRKWIQSRK